MKKIFPVILFILLITSATSTSAQSTNDSLPAYLQFPMLPSFNLLTLDSQKIFNTNSIPAGKKIMLIMFSPDCHHCEQLTDNIVQNMRSLQNTRIYMVTPMSLKATNEFYEKKQLAKYRNIVVAKDYEFFFPKYYKAYEVPFIVIYDRNKKLIKGFDQSTSFAEVLKAL